MLDYNYLHIYRVDKEWNTKIKDIDFDKYDCIIFDNYPNYIMDYEHIKYNKLEDKTFVYL